MTEDIKKQTEDGMKKSVESLTHELKKVRTGRATVSMLDPVVVSYYGSPTPLSQVATVSCPDARSFLITPWEASILTEIEAGIVGTNLGLAPQNDGKCIRLKVPELTEERRKNLVKSIKKTVEDARIAVRMSRKVANDELKQAEKNKKISEDDLKRAQDEIQKITDEYIKKIDVFAEEKEKELLTL